ncbi:uncharacterized protein LOC142339923 [Convolutriloba macropyga]|uniref:uncharacterized protein LOC142339923 n=1 Tax=Convolutriloba macropyga TaxID=536237 RepID=UPI003F525C00
MAAETSTEQPPKGPRNLAQMFHYHYSNTLDAENAKLPQWNKVTTTNDWLSKDNRMKQIKASASWYASSFSAALSSSINSDEKEKEKAIAKGNSEEASRNRRQSLNTMLGVTGVSKTDTEKIIRAHLYQLDDEIPDPVEIKETEARMGKKKVRKGKKLLVTTTRKPKVSTSKTAKGATQKDLFYY